MRLYWAGNEESFELVLQAQAKVDALQKQPGMTAGYIDEMIAKLPPIWQHEGSTAVVRIQGPVINGEAGFLRLFGVVGYDDIGKAAIEAASHVDTEKMLYHIDSPGGDVAGIVDIGALLGQISSIKQSAVHTTDLLCSAGYWLATSIKGQLSAGPTAIVGSIGVLSIHRENSKMMEDAGIKTTVLRSGKYKAEVNSVEPLSAEAKGRAEAQLADVHAMFRAHVGRGRPDMSAEQLAEGTEGQTFLGKRAVSAGLVDRIGSYDQALNLLDKQKHSRDTSSNSKGKAMKLTPEQLIAIAAGAPLASFGFKADGTPMSAEELTAYEAQVATDAKAAADAKVVADAAAAKIAADAKAASDAAPEGVVALLEKQLATANAQITTLTVAASAAEKATTAHDALLTIARKATANMLIPMGGTSAAVDGMDAAAVIAEHARVTPLFLEKFKPGQVSHNAKATEDKGAALPVGFEYAVKSAPSAQR